MQTFALKYFHFTYKTIQQKSKDNKFALGNTNKCKKIHLKPHTITNHSTLSESSITLHY